MFGPTRWTKNIRYNKIVYGLKNRIVLKYRTQNKDEFIGSETK